MTTNAVQIQQAREQLAKMSRLAYSRGLSSGVSGNFSARVPGCPNMVLIKASGVCFGMAEAEDFVLVDLDGNLLEMDKKPSKEVHFHCGIYRIRQEVQSVLHGHSAYATAYGTKKEKLPAVTAAAQALIKRVGIVDFAPAGSQELAQMVIRTFADDPEMNACILKQHGFITTGKNTAAAFYMGDVLEDNARTLYYMDTMGM
ncbi:class II aldolase/adducin family protein [Clostridium sp. AM58-1XD]|uniref:class II aldolase/adducin family protein n=1 Tax=Clostridium sp. AM58-1XD TaxID=2292307 RepID=UPI000E4A60AC|nr:class II aldolase/adducin family protein [Clostridium sp. AM58-1XD]RGY96942.1 class II aldolase/adducin family protein [Clostridium sp. AM58-1XD]